MNDSSTSTAMIALFCALRCLIPLAVLFGISYLVQRMGLVNDHFHDSNLGKAEGKINTPKGTPVKKRTKNAPASPKNRSRVL